MVTDPARPMRADAARNRARVLEVAYETFAAEGLSVPIDEIARRAGVGAGTVYRHFPTKEALFAAVIDDRVQGHRRRRPGAARLRGTRRGAVRLHAGHGRDECRPTTDLVEALAGYGIDVDAAAPGAEAAFLGCSASCWPPRSGRAPRARDVGVAEVKALLVVCKATQSYGDEVSRPGDGGDRDGLRASS